MKKLLIIIALCFTSITIACAQDSEHFKFKGIPINGNISNFGSQLVAEGFTKVSDNKYRGKFLRNDSVVAIVGDDNNMIWRVAVFMATIDTWNDLESSFNGYIELYGEKYGAPNSTSKKFSSYTGDDSWLKMDALHDGECFYNATWNLPQGSIEIRIVEGTRSSTGRICIVYTDGANKTKVHQSDLDEI